jgi:hypothetical protein
MQPLHFHGGSAETLKHHIRYEKPQALHQAGCMGIARGLAGRDKDAWRS